MKNIFSHTVYVSLERLTRKEKDVSFLSSHLLGKMEIVVGNTAGFCYGVKRAVDGAIEELNNNKNIDCLGEIVHNKQVIEKLKNRGLKFIEKIEYSAGTTIIRAHGIPKEIYEFANLNKIKIKDYTCPNVLKIHQIVEEFSKNGYYIVLCGSGNHPENIGTISYCGKYYSIIETEDDVRKAINNLQKSKMKKVLLIAQTTYSLQRFDNIQKEIKKNLSENIEVVIKNTICKATELRQKETEQLSKEVDYMIIIGGKNSSNTKKLYEISKQNCENSICIEIADELDVEAIKRYKKIGIMAGASTPQDSINSVVEKVNCCNTY